MWNSEKSIKQIDQNIKIQSTECLCKKEQPPYEPPTDQKPKLQKLKKKKKQDDEQYCVRYRHQQANLIRWSKSQDILYMKFLLDNSDCFSNENLRRSGKVFMHLSQAMHQTRTPNQCKSHHQKMQKAAKTGQVNQIIQYLCKKYAIVRIEDVIEGCVGVELGEKQDCKDGKDGMERMDGMEGVDGVEGKEKVAYTGIIDGAGEEFRVQVYGGNGGNGDCGGDGGNLGNFWVGVKLDLGCVGTW